MTQLFRLVGCMLLVLIGAMSLPAISFHSAMATIKAAVTPGQSLTRSFQLTLDQAEQRTQFKVSVQDWWRSEDGTQSFYRPGGTLAHSCTAWIQLNPTEATVEPGGVLDVRLSIAVPAATKPGGYWCALTVDQVPDPLQAKPEGVGLTCLTSISVGVFLLVGQVQREATIQNVVLVPGLLLVTLRNDGNCPLGADGWVEFFRPGEKTAVTKLTIPRETVLTEPFNSFKYSIRLPDTNTLPRGKYLMRVVFDIGADHYFGVQKEVDLTDVLFTPTDTTANKG